MTGIDTQLLTQNLLWSAGGLVVGLIIGAMFARTTGARTRLDRLRSLSGLVIIVLLVGSQVTYYRTTAESRALVECYRPFYEQVAENLAQRSAAQGATGAGQIEVLERSLQADPAAAEQAIRAYVAALRELESVRMTAPLPQPPDCEGS